MLDRRLADREFVAGDALSIADIAIWPWAILWERQEQSLDDKPHFGRWLAALGQRPAFLEEAFETQAIQGQLVGLHHGQQFTGSARRQG